MIQKLSHNYSSSHTVSYIFNPVVLTAAFSDHVAQAIQVMSFKTR